MNENSQSPTKLYKANITKVAVKAMIGIQLQWTSKIVSFFLGRPSNAINAKTRKKIQADVECL